MPLKMHQKKSIIVLRHQWVELIPVLFGLRATKELTLLCMMLGGLLERSRLAFVVVHGPVTWWLDKLRPRHGPGPREIHTTPVLSIHRTYTAHSPAHIGGSPSLPRYGRRWTFLYINHTIIVDKHWTLRTVAVRKVRS